MLRQPQSYNLCCPKCKAGPFPVGGSFSAHLRQCRAPMLWDRFDVGKDNNKRILSETVDGPMTLAQQANKYSRLNNDGHGSGLVRTTNHIAAMPSIQDLARTVEDLSEDQFQFDEDAFYDESEDYDNTETNDGTTPSSCPEQIELNPFRRFATLPPGMVYQLHMQNILNGHRRVDLNLFTEINECVQLHALHYNVDFSSVKLYSRQHLINELVKAYNLHAMKPKLHRVTLSDKSQAVVPVFDIKTMLVSLLNDPSRMKKENIAPNYDLFTGKPIGPVENLDEIHTGSSWETARAHYCGDDPDVMPLGLIGFYDKTHSDVFGSLACAPFLFIPSFFNEECRYNTDFYTVGGYIPNLSHGKGSSNRQPSREKLQDEHDCLRLITRQLIKIQEEGGFWTTVMGRKVRVVVWLHILCGDTSGHNNVCGHYNVSGNTSCPYRDCKCGFTNLSDAMARCQLITLEEMNDARGNRARLKELSKHDIRNAFEGVPVSDLVHGYLGVCPGEMLHVSGGGLIKYQFQATSDLIGPNDSKKKEKDQLDTLHQKLVHDAAHQSERDFPRMSDHSITDGTKCCATQRVGNHFILLCLSYTADGVKLLSPGWRRYGITQQGFRDCIKLQLGFEKWVNDSNPISEVERATPLLSTLIDSIKTCFPRESGQGWNIPKVHALAKMIMNMLKFGKAKNFSGQIGERVLKKVVKEIAENTQRRAVVFAEQCAARMFELEVFEHAFEDVRSLLGLDFERVHNFDPSFVSCEGTYLLTFMICDRYGRGSVKVDWNDKLRNRLQIGVHDLMTLAIRRYSVDNGWTGQFDVIGHTSVKFTPAGSTEPITFRANDYVYGGKWYDYCMVQFEEDGIEKAETVAPAQIVGFFSYGGPGVPTPHFIDDEGQSLEDIQQHFERDTNIYAVVHTSTTNVSWKSIENDFVVPFKLGPVSRGDDGCLFIIKIENIIDPLFVFKNYGGTGQSAGQLFCSLPYRRWGKYFSDRVPKE